MEEQQSIKEDHLTEKASKVAENTSEERPATIAEAAIKAVREEKTISETIEGRTSKPQSMTASESPLAVPEGLLQRNRKKSMGNHYCNYSCSLHCRWYLLVHAIIVE